MNRREFFKRSLTIAGSLLIARNSNASDQPLSVYSTQNKAK